MNPSTYLFCVLGFFFVGNVLTEDELVSPCPKIFQYERNATEPDRWYGTAVVSSEQDLVGVWFRVILDSKSDQLGNWFGEVENRDDFGYLIKNPNYKLRAGTELKINFYVRYDPSEPPPKVVSFRLNAVVKCPEEGYSTELPQLTGQLFTNKPRVRGKLLTKSSDEEQSNIQGRKPSILDSNICGRIAKPLALNGDIIQEGDFPWHAALYHSQRIDLKYICGASLITLQHLVTAAHCVTKNKSTITVNSDNLVVYLGKLYLRVWKSPGIQDKRVDKIMAHPKYNPQSLGNDIAVLKLTEPAELTRFVRPICLWEGPTHLDYLVNEVGSVVGWGFDNDGKVTGQLINAHMHIVSQGTCTLAFPESYSRVPSDTTFCAGFENGTSVCNGDSGSGLMLPRPGSNRNPVWQIRGLVSVSVALQNRVTCDSSHYVVFTDIARYLDFMKNSIKQHDDTSKYSLDEIGAY